MADEFDPDAYLATKSGGGTAVAEPPAFDPDAYLAEREPPVADTAATTPPSRFPSAYIPSDTEKEVTQRFDEAHPVLGAIGTQFGRAGSAAIDTGVGFIKGLPSMAKLIKPPTLTDVLSGAAETVGQMKTATEAPIGSQEWWNATVPLAAQAGMEIGGLRASSPKLSEVLFPEKPPVQAEVTEPAANAERPTPNVERPITEPEVPAQTEQAAKEVIPNAEKPNVETSALPVERGQPIEQKATVEPEAGNTREAPAEVAAQEAVNETPAQRRERINLKIQARRKEVGDFASVNEGQTFEIPLTQLHPERQAKIVVSPSVKFPGKVQATVIDRKGPSSDVTFNSVNDALQDADRYYGLDLSSVRRPETRPPQPQARAKFEQPVMTEGKALSEASGGEMSPEYATALKKSNAATREFMSVQEQYRNRKIGDDEFLAAKAKHDQAQAEFDKAFSDEQNRKPTKPAADTAAATTKELFQPNEVPFNLRGEAPQVGMTAEGQARAAAQSASEQSKAQPELSGMPEAERPTIAGKYRETAEERALREEYERETMADFEEHMGHGGQDLTDALKSLGGVNPKSPNFKDLTEEFGKKAGFSKVATGSGEKIKYTDIFRKDALDDDRLVLKLREKGFDVENAGQLADLIQERLRTGKKVFGMEARAMEPDITGLEGYAMGAAGTKEIPLRGWKDMIDAGEMPALSPTAEQAATKFVGKVLDTVGRSFRNMRDFITIEPVPAMSRAGLSDAAYEHASARNSVVHSVRHLLSRVFPDEYKNPEVMKKTGDILVKDNILGIYDQAKARFEATKGGQTELDLAEHNAADKAMQAIEKAHDLEAYDRDVQAAKNNPTIAANMDRWKAWVNSEMDRMYNEIKRYDPWTIQEERGRHFGARINLLTKDQAGEVATVTDMSKAMPELPTSNYRNPNVKRDPFMRQAKGTGQYETDPGMILTNSLARRWNEITKVRLYDAIEKTGNGFITEAGERPAATEINGEPLARMAVKIPETDPKTGRTRIVEKSLWIRKSLARETRDVLNTDMAAPNNPVFRGLTQLQILGLTDMTAHMKNIHSVVANSLGASKGWVDAVRKMPFLATADTVGRIAAVTREVMADTPAMRDEIAQMARQGMIRPSYPPTGIQKITRGQQAIHSVDTASRIVMNRFWDNLVDRGFVNDSMQGRRAFVNQIGEYNRRLLGHFTRNLRDYGASPFIVAGRTFNRFSKRLLIGDPGFKAATPQAAALARAYQLSSLTMAATLPAIINYFTTGKFGGRPGTPIGAIDTGTNNSKGDKRIIDIMHLMGIRRGLRATGLGAVVEGVREGKSVNEIGGKAIEDITSAASHPWLGPGLSAIYSGITGKRLDLRGGGWPYIAKQIPEGGLHQYAENLRVTLKNQNPMIYGLLAPLIGETEDTYGQGVAKGFLKAPLAAFGLMEKPGDSAFAAAQGARKQNPTGRGR